MNSKSVIDRNLDYASFFLSQQARQTLQKKGAFLLAEIYKKLWFLLALASTFITFTSNVSSSAKASKFPNSFLASIVFPEPGVPFIKAADVPGTVIFSK